MELITNDSIVVVAAEIVAHIARNGAEDQTITHGHQREYFLNRNHVRGSKFIQCLPDAKFIQ